MQVSADLSSGVLDADPTNIIIFLPLLLLLLRTAALLFQSQCHQTYFRHTLLSSPLYLSFALSSSLPFSYLLPKHTVDHSSRTVESRRGAENVRRGSFCEGFFFLRALGMKLT